MRRVLHGMVLSMSLCCLVSVGRAADAMDSSAGGLPPVSTDIAPPADVDSSSTAKGGTQRTDVEPVAGVAANNVLSAYYGLPLTLAADGRVLYRSTIDLDGHTSLSSADLPAAIDVADFGGINNGKLKPYRVLPDGTITETIYAQFGMAAVEWNLVPEPTAGVTFILGVGLIGARRRRIQTTTNG